MMKQPSLHKHMCMSVEHINTGKLIPVILSQGRQWAMFLEVQYIPFSSKQMFFQCCRQCCCLLKWRRGIFFASTSIVHNVAWGHAEILDCHHLFFEMHLCLLLEKGMATTPVFLPGESHGQRSLVGYSPWRTKESNTTELLTLSL